MVKVENCQKSQKIGIIGGGIAGAFCAIQIKELHPDYDVFIIEHNDKLLKKIYATGNGKCNFANAGDLLDKYTNESFAMPILNEYGYKEISNYFDSIGIPNILNGNLAYPYSKNSNTVALKILGRLLELEIKFVLKTNFVDYFKIKTGFAVETDRGHYVFDKMVFAIGGKSSPQLGSDGSVFNVLKEHNYLIKEMFPSLCPIKVKENTKLIDGIRNDVELSIYEGNKLIHKECGELLFKDKGISGIVCFNACHYLNQINKNSALLHVNFVKDVTKDISKKEYINYVHPKLAKYLVDNNLDIKDTVFTFKDFYDFTTSQVSAGGLEISNVNSDLESRRENGVYFIGEMLDVDAICGGYNMMWAFASAYHVAKVI